MIERHQYLDKINYLLRFNPVVALIGPRQVGKSTLAREVAKLHSPVTYFDLENSSDVSRFVDPLLTLNHLTGLAILDEVQHLPDIFKTLRVLADRPNKPCKFLILGSAAPELLKQNSETLAGRIAFLEIQGFTLSEVGIKKLDKLWHYGSFPKAFLAQNESESVSWRQDFIRTFLERDLPQLGIKIPALTMRRFWMMLAHYHGQLWNSSEISRAFGISDKTARNYLDILSSAFIIKQLPPWWENISKRQVKSPKIYFNDSGILHTLLGIDNQTQLEGRPKVGASWEGFVMNNVLKQINALTEETFFWKSHTGVEIDLLVIHGQYKIGFKFKRASLPQVTRSIHQAQEDLCLTKTYIVHAGQHSFELAKNVIALSAYRLLEDLAPIR